VPEHADLFRRLVDRSPDGILVSRQDRIELANPAAVRLCAMESPDWLLGTATLALFCAAGALAFGQSVPEIPFDSNPDFFKLPDDLHFGDISVENLKADGNLSNAIGKIVFRNGKGEQRIENSFGAIDLTGNLGSVDVSVANGIVELRGQVADASQSEAIELKTRMVSGVRDVRNMLHLPGETPPNMVGTPGVQPS